VLVLKVLSRLPLRVLYAMTDCLYVFIYHIWRFRRKLALSNLTRSFPDKSAQELEQIARQAYRNACDMIAEVLKGAVIGEQELRQRVRILNIDALARFTRAGQSVIMLASHQCNWEWLLLASCLELRVGVDAVYKPLRVAAIDRFMLGMRSRFGGSPSALPHFELPNFSWETVKQLLIPTITIAKREGGALEISKEAELAIQFLLLIK
jgi:KDO2-lipid IV(A) lauroyltransferase